MLETCFFHTLVNPWHNTYIQPAGIAQFHESCSGPTFITIDILHNEKGVSASCSQLSHHRCITHLPFGEYGLVFPVSIDHHVTTISWQNRLASVLERSAPVNASGLLWLWMTKRHLRIVFERGNDSDPYFNIFVYLFYPIGSCAMDFPRSKNPSVYFLDVQSRVGNPISPVEQCSKAMFYWWSYRVRHGSTIQYIVAHRTPSWKY